MRRSGASSLRHRGLRSSSTKGFTVIEAIVALALVSLVFFILWTIASSSARNRRFADHRLQGASQGLAFIARIERDLAHLYFDNSHQVIVEEGLQPRLSFHIVDKESSDFRQGEIVTKSVSYNLERSARKIYRTLDGKKEPIHGHFAQLKFKKKKHVDYLQLPPNSKKLVDELSLGGIIDYVVTAIPRELASLPANQWKKNDATALWGTLALEPINGRWRHYYWLTNITTQSE